jgi:hypothetical protein
MTINRPDVVALIEETAKAMTGGNHCRMPSGG